MEAASFCEAGPMQPGAKDTAYSPTLLYKQGVYILIYYRLDAAVCITAARHNSRGKKIRRIASPYVCFFISCLY